MSLRIPRRDGVDWQCKGTQLGPQANWAGAVDDAMVDDLKLDDVLSRFEVVVDDHTVQREIFQASLVGLANRSTEKFARRWACLYLQTPLPRMLPGLAAR